MYSKLGTRPTSGAVTLATVAHHARLTVGTVSAILNASPASKVIPQKTKDRVFAVARELNYQPNFFARSLRKKKSCMVGVIVSDIGDQRVALVLAAIENVLSAHGYFFIIGVHKSDYDLGQKCSNLMVQRGIEGLIIIDLDSSPSSAVPSVVMAIDSPLSPESSNVHAVNQNRGEMECLGGNAATTLLQQIDEKTRSTASKTFQSKERSSPTIADIARAAGVSNATVSYALNGSSPVSPETSAIIQRIANECQYQPNVDAVRLGRLGRGRPRSNGTENAEFS